MIQLGDITKIDVNDLIPVDIVCGGSPCQDFSISGSRQGLKGSRSGLFMEYIRIIKGMREKYGKPRYIVFENVQGLLSSNNGEDFRTIIESIAKISDPDTSIPRPTQWLKSGMVYLKSGASISWRIHNAQFYGTPQKRKRIAVVADFDSNTAPKILFEEKELSAPIESSRKRKKTTTHTATRSDNGSYCIGNGRLHDLLIMNEEVSRTLSCVKDPMKVLTVNNGELKLRNLMPIEYERLQGYPDNYTDIGKWVDSNGRNHNKSADITRYMALGNSICLPYWELLAKKIIEELNVENPTMGSLFDGIGGFPLVFSRNGCKPIWASEINDFAKSVTNFHFPIDK